MIIRHGSSFVSSHLHHLPPQTKLLVFARDTNDWFANRVLNGVNVTGVVDESNRDRVTQVRTNESGQE